MLMTIFVLDNGVSTSSLGFRHSRCLVLNQDDIDSATSGLLRSNKRSSRLGAAYLYAIKVCTYFKLLDSPTQLQLNAVICLCSVCLHIRQVLLTVLL